MAVGYRPHGPPKMPVRQLVILSVARFSEPIAMTSILPYLPEMVESFGVKKEDVGHWAGICMASFSLSQSFCGIPWGAASDHFGRKPAVVFGLFTTMVAFILWGLSRSLLMAIAVRIFSGVSNGNVGIIRTMVAEMVPWKELQPTAFSIMPMVWSVGSVFGPTMGGFFANPARQWPGVFGHIQFFKDYPYALPSFLAASIFLCSLASAIFFLEETMESKKQRPDWGVEIGKRFLRAFGHKDTAAAPASDDEAGAGAPLIRDTPRPAAGKPRPHAKHTARDVLSMHTTCFLLSYFFLAFHSVSCDQTLAVFLSQPLIEHTPENTQLPFKFAGGFGFSSDKIGTIFTIYGFIGLLQFVIYPPVCKALGVLRCLQLCSVMHPIYLGLMPYIVLIPGANGRWYGVLCVIIFKGVVNLITFPSLTMLITNSAPSTAVLGTINGISVTVAGFGRALGPALSGLVFTWGTYHSYAIASWWFLAAVSAVGIIPAFLVDEPRGFGQNDVLAVEGECDDHDEMGTRCLSDSEDDSGVDLPSGNGNAATRSETDEEQALFGPERGRIYGTTV